MKKVLFGLIFLTASLGLAQVTRPGDRVQLPKEASALSFKIGGIQTGLKIESYPSSNGGLVKLLLADDNDTSSKKMTGQKDGRISFEKSNYRAELVLRNPGANPLMQQQLDRCVAMAAGAMFGEKIAPENSSWAQKRGLLSFDFIALSGNSLKYTLNRDTFVVDLNQPGIKSFSCSM